MSDQGYTAAESEDTGIFCQKCSPSTRKIGYYLTFGFGFIVFGIGIIMMVTLSSYLLVAGSLIILLSPLWIKSPSILCSELKNPIRLTSCIIFLVFLALSIINLIMDWSFVINIIAGIGLALSGIWYFLSFFENGQQACLACLKTCWKKQENQGESQPEVSGEGQTEENA